MKRGATAVALLLLTVTLAGAAGTPTPAPSEPPSPVADDLADPVRAAEYWLDQYGVREAWRTTRGAGTRIAIIDTGVGAGPVEFDGAVVAATDVSGVGSLDGRTPVGGRDKNHGSWVASLAAARGTGDGRGMIGVAPEAELLSISVGFGSTSSVPITQQIAEAIRWAVDHDADVINLSLTTNTLDWDESWDDAFLYAFDHDVVVVVAAGNRGNGTKIVGAPATIPGVLAVGGVDPAGLASVEASTQGVTIGVVAPSEQLLGVSGNGALLNWRGTSGAAPLVAGIAALVRSAHPQLDANNVINRLIRTASPPPGVSNPPPELYGSGLVNASAAVTAQVASVEENPMGSLEEWVRVYRRAQAGPAPEPTTTPIEVPPLDAPDEPSQASSRFLPSEGTLRYGTVPLMGGTVAAIMIALGVTAAARRIRLARALREPSRKPT